MAFGSADSQVYCYDLRHIRVPLCTLTGHQKAVSFIRFVDSKTIVSASTDNTLKLWDFTRMTTKAPRASTSVGSRNDCVKTFTGHTNLKVIDCLQPQLISMPTSCAWFISLKPLNFDSDRCFLVTQNFVGLSVVEGGYIACGSETNEVCNVFMSFDVLIIKHYAWFLSHTYLKCVEPKNSIFHLVEHDSAVCLVQNMKYNLAVCSTAWSYWTSYFIQWFIF